MIETLNHSFFNIEKILIKWLFTAYCCNIDRLFFFKSTLQKRVRDSINDEQRWNYIDLRNLKSNHRWKAMINVVNGDSWSIFVAYWSTLWLKFNIDASLMQRRSTLRLENDFSTAATERLLKMAKVCSTYIWEFAYCVLQ